MQVGITTNVPLEKDRVLYRLNSIVWKYRRRREATQRAHIVEEDGKLKVVFEPKKSDRAWGSMIYNYIRGEHFGGKKRDDLIYAYVDQHVRGTEADSAVYRKYREELKLWVQRTRYRYDGFRALTVAHPGWVLLPEELSGKTLMRIWREIDMVMQKVRWPFRGRVEIGVRKFTKEQAKIAGVGFVYEVHLAGVTPQGYPVKLLHDAMSSVYVRLPERVQEAYNISRGPENAIVHRKKMHKVSGWCGYVYKGTLKSSYRDPSWKMPRYSTLTIRERTPLIESYAALQAGALSVRVNARRGLLDKEK